MGFESFRVELSGGETNYMTAIRLITTLPFVTVDPNPSILLNQPNTYVFNDGSHVFEIEIKDLPLRVSCRFALCHPDSVDAAFVEFIKTIMSLMNMNVLIADGDDINDNLIFSLVDFNEFNDRILRSISIKRDDWIKFFGNTRMSITTNEVYKVFIFRDV